MTTKISMNQAIAEAKEGFIPRFYGGAYGDRLHFDLDRHGNPVYARTPFDDLNGTALTTVDHALEVGSVVWIESGRLDADAAPVAAAPFSFFDEV